MYIHRINNKAGTSAHVHTGRAYCSPKIAPIKLLDYSKNTLFNARKYLLKDASILDIGLVR